MGWAALDSLCGSPVFLGLGLPSESEENHVEQLGEEGTSFTPGPLSLGREGWRSQRERLEEVVFDRLPPLAYLL